MVRQKDFTVVVLKRHQRIFRNGKMPKSNGRACVSSCRDSGEETLSMKNQAILNVYPKTKLSLGLDLQGGIDMDLEVEISYSICTSTRYSIYSTGFANQGHRFG